MPRFEKHFFLSVKFFSPKKYYVLIMNVTTFLIFFSILVKFELSLLLVELRVTPQWIFMKVAQNENVRWKQWPSTLDDHDDKK